MLKIFVGSTSYENILTRKFLQHSVCDSAWISKDSVTSFLAGRARKERQEEETYGESNSHGRVFRKELL